MMKSLLSLVALVATPAFADLATVQNVNVTKTAEGYVFNVTILHTDTGWDDHVDVWRIKDTEGNILGERQLAHPHVNEQPFTRSLSGVRIPDGVDTVIVEAHDTVNGWSPNIKTIKLP